MFYGNTVQDTRALFYSSWLKYRQKKELLPLERQIVEVIIEHPEYHEQFETPVPEHHQPYFPELGQSNPFLHLGFHLAIRDQITLDKPSGILFIYQQLIQKHKDKALVEHLLMERLAECLWRAQRHQQMPDEQHYLNDCRELLRLS